MQQFRPAFDIEAVAREALKDWHKFSPLSCQTKLEGILPAELPLIAGNSVRVRIILLCLINEAANNMIIGGGILNLCARHLEGIVQITINTQPHEKGTTPFRATIDFPAWK